MSDSSITIFAGHYGSGKTSLAVAYALELKRLYDQVVVADLDIVNPYFRTKDSASALEANNIRLISSRYANTNLDAPSIPPEANALFDRQVHGVIDLGGDDRGALALGRYSEKLADCSDLKVFLVVNMYRPLSRDTESVLEIMQDIQAAARIRFTGIINNSNLGAETTVEDVLQSLDFAQRLSALTGLPIAKTSVRRELISQFPPEAKALNLFPIDLEEYKWQQFQK